ncbi:PAS domain-containing protein [Antarcticibacterium sp. 1MA-6-2]|uniref:PAS domain-containing protein n=1 Tax=Antarcticibacterium sp. 1MA-6-2 TaxID=2908210 RepID=UPI001F217CEA|nr:PAS domain-containing protein [Antarcticibacterium sp. 1MA-6-2]UJH92163.1 PAS domain-containing protein [Antarcticibacterium sp. 1MA-6-2]
MTEYQEIFKTLPFPALLLGCRENVFIVKDVSKKFCDLSGKKADEIIGKSYPWEISAFPKSHFYLAKRLKSIETAFATGKAHHIDCLQHDLNTAEREGRKESYWQIQNIPLKDNYGRVLYILNIAIERTPEILVEREKNEFRKKLHSQQEEQKHFIENNPDGLYSLDTKGNFLSLNNGLANIAELPREEMLHMNFLPFCTAHHRELTLNNFQKVLKGEEQEFEAEFITARKNIVVLRVSMIPMKINGKISGLYGIAKDITNLRSAEEELVSLERVYKALVQEGSDLTTILNLDGTFKYVSDSSVSVLGISPESFIGKNAFDFIHPEDKDRVLNKFSLLVNDEQVRVEAFRFQDKEGNWRWLESTATNFCEDPHVNGIVVNSKEVTELVERNGEIKQLFERYRLAVTATEDLVYDWDLRNDEVVRLHKGTVKPFGYSPGEVEKKEFWKENVHPQEIDKVKNQIERAMETPDRDQVKTKYRFKRANGTYANIIDRAHIVRNEKGEAIRLIGATSDISDIVENQKELKAANRRFSFVMQATKEIIWDWDLIKKQIKRSGSFKKLFGYSTPRETSVEEFWCQKIVERDRNRVINSIKTALDNPEIKKWEEEYCFIKRNGEEAYIVDRGYILRDPSGKAIRMVGAALDVSESKRMVKEIQKQNKVLQEVAWEQAHIVRAPLARLKGLLGLLEMESYEEWSREELLKLINDSATELDEVIRNIIKRTEENERKAG